MREVIKEIRIRQENGTLSPILDIGAKAENIEFNDGTTLDGVPKKVEDNANAIVKLENKTNALAEGGPAGVYDNLQALIAANPDHGRIYITLDNGNWNYYNGSTFVSGGIYQSSAIGTNKIKYDNLNKNIKDSFNTLYNLPVDNIEEFKGQIEVDGTIQTIVPDNIIYIKKAVNENETLYLNFDFDKLNYSLEGTPTAIYAFYDKDNNLINIKTTNTENSNHNYTENNVNVPKNASYILCNITKNYIPHYTILTLNKVKQNEPIKYEDLDNSLKENYKIAYDKLIQKEAVAEKVVFTSQADIATANGYNIVKYKIKPNTLYYIENARNGYNGEVKYCISGNQSKNTKNVNNIDYTYNTPSLIVLCNNSSEVLENVYFKSPEYSVDLFITTTNINKDMLKLYEGEVFPKSIDNTNKLRGLKMIYDGDSICEGRFDYKPNGGAYAKLIADETNSTFVNQAISGAVVSSVIGTPLEGRKHSVYDNLNNLPKDGDIYCFEGGYNDYALSIELGNITESFDGSLDITTVCGAVEGILRYALKNYVGKHICYVLTHKVLNEAIVPNQTGKTLTEYHDAIKSVCKKYSIPVYDAFEKSGLNGFIPEQNQAFLHGDGTHPNEEGYKLYYVPQIISLYNSMIK